MFSWFKKEKKRSPSKEEILNAGLKMALEWGENWLKPIQGRLSKAYPDLKVEELNKYNSSCQAAMKFGCDTVYEMAERYGKETKQKEFEAIFLQRYPWVNEKNLSHIFSQGMYYAWKDFGL
ncbi:MAG: hypothetical protein VW877_15865 [Pseudomonadaceae bacterium]